MKFKRQFKRQTVKVVESIALDQGTTERRTDKSELLCIITLGVITGFVVLYLHRREWADTDKVIQIAQKIYCKSNFFYAQVKALQISLPAKQNLLSTCCCMLDNRSCNHADHTCTDLQIFTKADMQLQDAAAWFVRRQCNMRGVPTCHDTLSIIIKYACKVASQQTNRQFLLSRELTVLSNIS